MKKPDKFGVFMIGWSAGMVTAALLLLSGGCSHQAGEKTEKQEKFYSLSDGTIQQIALLGYLYGTANERGWSNYDSCSMSNHLHGILTATNSEDWLNH